jgi:hypothetical protein
LTSEESSGGELFPKKRRQIRGSVTQMPERSVVSKRGM